MFALNVDTPKRPKRRVIYMHFWFHLKYVTIRNSWIGNVYPRYEND